MAFTEGEKVQIREYMGATSLYQGIDSQLESAMTSVGDGGATEDRIRDEYLVALAAIDDQIATERTRLLAGNVDEAKIDPVRAVAALRAEGRMWVGRLARALGMAPRSDCYGPMMPSGWQNYSGLP